MSSIPKSVLFPTTPEHAPHLCQRGTSLLTEWLRAEPRLIALLPEVLELPTQLLVAASSEGEMYLAHVRECAKCCNTPVAKAS